MYEGVKFSLQKTLSFIRGYHQEICLSHENIKSFSSSMTEKLRKPPNNGFIKINFDAPFQRDSRTSIAAVLARDYKCEVVGASTYVVENVVFCG